MVRADRLDIHIIKCSKQYPVHYTCPYNALHRFLNKDEFETHIIKGECPNQTTLKWDQPMPQHRGNLDPQPLHIEGTREFNMEFENWDDEYIQDEEEDWDK